MRLFDLHCDTLYECYTKNYPLMKNAGHIDLVRAEKYAPYVQAFAVWIPDTLRGEAAFDFCRRMFTFSREEEGRSGEKIRFLRKGESLDDAMKVSENVGILAVEGGAALGGDLSRIADLADFGVKYITITWNGSNELGHGCLSGVKTGLTPFGKAAVKALSAAGIAADVSHLNEAGFWDVAEVLEGPFLATHSNAAAVCPHPRNLTDRQFQEIARRGGLVGLNFCGAFLGEATFQQIERHLAHFLSLGGEDAVCFGC
ncbi:MAG: membrane dipeptidase, partial [Clostridia bacterium]|nr:membrane dipeptidase [Clostridia bacterium]